MRLGSLRRFSSLHFPNQLELSRPQFLALPRANEFSQDCSNPELTLAGQIYQECLRGRPETVVGTWLKSPKLADKAIREFVVPLVQKLLRNHLYLSAATQLLPENIPPGAYPCLLLLRDHALHYSMLPLHIKLSVLLKRAVGQMNQAPLSQRSSVPSLLVDSLVAERGEEEAAALCSILREAPPITLRTNTLKTTPRDLLHRLKSESHIRAKPTKYSPIGLTLTSYANVFKTGAFFDGWFEVQDEGSQLVSLLCGAADKSVVVDACAGKGGKTLHLSAIMQKKGELFALDRGGGLSELQRRAQRAGAKVQALSTAPAGLRGDVVLVSAPCSGLGLLQRHPEIGWREVAVSQLARAQGELLEQASNFVKPGGRLVYTTRSFLREENDDVVDSFLRSHSDFTAESARDILLRQYLPNDLPFAGERLRLDPLRHGTDGIFAAVLSRKHS